MSYLHMNTGVSGAFGSEPHCVLDGSQELGLKHQMFIMITHIMQ